MLWRDSCALNSYEAQLKQRMRYTHRGALKSIRSGLDRTGSVRTGSTRGGYELDRLMFHDPKDPLTVHTVHLSNHDLKDAKRLLGILTQALDQGSEENSQAAAGPGKTLDRLKLRARAAELIRLNQRRLKFFPRAMFGEAPWEMLITLYVSDARFSIGKLGD